MSKLRNYPYFVYQLLPGFSVTKTINFLPLGVEPPKRGITIFVEKEVDRNEPLTPALKTAIRRLGKHEQNVSGLPLCAVYGPNECDYFSADGSPCPSEYPPKLGVRIGESLPVSSLESDGQGALAIQGSLERKELLNVKGSKIIH